MSDIMAAQHAFNYAMNFYPILYASENLDSAKFKFYDQVFNMLGNSFSNLVGFLEAHDTTENEELLQQYPSKYIGKELLFDGYTNTYTKLRTLADGTHRTITLGDKTAVVKELFTREEQEQYPEIIHWVPVLKREALPSPNFSKESSMVWSDDIDKLDISWTEAALWYYGKAKEFFNSDNSHLYLKAWPRDEIKQKLLIDEHDFAFSMFRCEDQTEQEWHKVISKAWGIEYTGDTKAFIQKRWKIELARINEFLDETIEHLNHKFTTRKIQQLRDEFNPSENIDKCKNSLTI